MAVLNVRGLLGDAGHGRPRVSYRADLITVLLGAWVIGGLLLDAWAHNNIPQLETFFTPWHAVFYSGFAAVATWICWIVWRNVQAGRRGLAAVPAGYGLGVFGLPLFALAGFADGVWHTVFGIEQDMKILFSPTHLVLVTALILIITGPLRSALADADLTEAPTLARLLPAVLALAFSTTCVLLFLQYANALIWSPHRILTALSLLPGDRPADDISPAKLVTSIAVTNVVLLTPMLLLLRRWRVPPGTATIIFVVVAALCGAITEFKFGPILLATVVAGLCVDGLLKWLRPGPRQQVPLLAFAALAPLVTWSVYLGFAMYAAGAVPTIVEYWTGIPVVAALQGLLLGLLISPQRTPTAATVG
jgi:hypothetical protein